MKSKKFSYRNSIRLKAYDYSQPGAYFVTIVTHNRNPLFGEIHEGEILLNALGQSIANAWIWLAMRHPYVELDEYVVMPNHLHGIVIIVDNDEKRKPLGQLIGAFKTITTKRINLAQGTLGEMLWQRNFYERVIRNVQEMERAREYIVNNPMGWSLDKENPNVFRSTTPGTPTLW